MFKILFIVLFLFKIETVFSAVTVTNVKSNSPIGSSNFSFKEGFIQLDEINVIYGAEIILSKSQLPDNYSIVNSDLPETDFSFMKKYEIITPSSGTVNVNTKAKQTSTNQNELSSETNLIYKTVPNLNQIKIITGSKKTIIQSSDGSDFLIIEWTPEKKGLVLQNCPVELLQLKELRNLTPQTPVGVYCNFNMIPGLMTVSPIKESRWSGSNLTEISGKGERYRTFEIPVGNTKGQASGILKINSQGQSLSFAIKVKKLEEKISNLFIGFQKNLSLGIASSDLQSESQSASSSSYFYEFNGLTEPLFNYLKFGFGFFNSFSLSEDTTLISTRDSKVSAGYYSNSKNFFNWGAWLGHRNFDIKQDVSSTKFQSSQFGYGANLYFNFSDIHQVEVLLEMASLGSKIVTSHMKTGIHYKYKFVMNNQAIYTGVLFELQNMKMLSIDNTSREYKLNKIGLNLDF